MESNMVKDSPEVAMAFIDELFKTMLLLFEKNLPAIWDYIVMDKHFINPRFPTGNEIGVNNLWIPGGLTSGGIPELVMDFSLRPKFSEIKIH